MVAMEQEFKINQKKAMTGRIVFHIGPGKTGTTYLQNNIFNKLSRINNIGRPIHNTKRYRNFQDAILRDEEPFFLEKGYEFRNEVIQSRQNYPVTLVSDENLFSKTPISANIRRLKDLFPEAEIIITVRNQLTAIQSFYLSGGYFLKGVPCADDFNRKRQISFNEYFDFSAKYLGKSYWTRYKYKNVLKTLEHYFSKNSIHILIFEEMTKQPDLFSKSLSTILDVPSDEILMLMQKSTKLNARQSAVSMKYKKLRTLIPIKSISRSLPGSRFIIQHIEKLISKSTKGASYAYSDKQIEKVSEIFRDDNRYLIDEYGINVEQFGYPT